MTFYTPFLQFNFSPGFALGNMIGQGLFGGIVSNWGGCCNPVMGNNSIFYKYSDTTFNTQFMQPTYNAFQNFNFNNGFMNNWMSNFNFNFMPAMNFGGTFGRTNINTTNKLGDLSCYNDVNGNMLAKDAKKHAKGFTGYCAAYVSDSLERTGLSNGQRGDGYQMAAILRQNKNFKEISTDVNYKNLPAGCILCYNKGAAGYSKNYGHCEITTGSGTAVSDGITKNIRKPSAIFIPV